MPLKILLVFYKDWNNYENLNDEIKEFFVTIKNIDFSLIEQSQINLEHIKKSDLILFLKPNERKDFFAFDKNNSERWSNYFEPYYSTWPVPINYWANKKNKADLSLFDFSEINGNRFVVHADIVYETEWGDSLNKLIIFLNYVKSDTFINKNEIADLEYDNYIKESKKIFLEYKQNYADEINNGKGDVAQDGLYSPNVFFIKNRPRIIALLFEGTNYDKDNKKLSWEPCAIFDNDDSLRAEKGNSNQVYLTILYEMRYLIGGFSNILYPKISDEHKLSCSIYHPSLKGVGHINIKKFDECNLKTNHQNLKFHLKRTKNLFRKHLLAIDMDIILCHGANQLTYLRDFVFQDYNIKLEKIDEKLWLLKYDNNKSFLVFVLAHPSRGQHKSTLQSFKKIADNNKEFIIEYLNTKGRIASLNWLT